MAAESPLSDALLDDGATAAGASERRTFAEASRAIRENRLDDAIGLLDATLTQDPGRHSLSLRALRAKLDYLRKDYLAAAARYADVAADADEMVSLRLNEALCLLRAERWDQAFVALFRLLALTRKRADDHEPHTHARLWGYLGVALEHMGRREDAETAYLAAGYEPAARRVRRQRLHFKLITSESVPTSAEGLEPQQHTHTEHAGALGHDSPATELPQSAPTPHETAPPPAFDESSPGSGISHSEPSLVRSVTERTHTSMASAAAPFDHSSLLPKPLLDTTLASLFVAEGSAPLSRHPSGLVRGVATPEAPLSYDPRARFAASETDAENDGPRSLRSGLRHGFLRADSGVLLLRPREAGESLHLIELGEEAFVLDDRFVVAFDGGLETQREPSAWPLEMLSFQGSGALVLGLPEPFLSFDVRDGQRFEVPAAAIVGWIGTLSATPAADGPNPWLLPLRFQGNGTLLFLSRPVVGRAKGFAPHQ